MKKMKPEYGLMFVILAGLACGCSSISVATDYEPSFDFTELETFAWLPEPPRPAGHALIDSPLFGARVREAVNAELARRGYRKAELADADFLLQYYASTKTVTKIDTVHRYHYGRRWHGTGYTDTTVREYDRGSLVLDIVDAESRELVWRGVGEARLYENRTPEERSERMREAVESILDEFPPR
jgi:hypothetical protein